MRLKSYFLSHDSGRICRDLKEFGWTEVTSEVFVMMTQEDTDMYRKANGAANLR